MLPVPKWRNSKWIARGLTCMAGGMALALLWAAEPPLSNRHIIDADLAGASRVHVADMDGDGDDDIVAATEAGKIVVYAHNGARIPVFAAHIVDASPDAAYEAYPVDLNRDGDIDIVAAGSFEGAVVWFENDGASPPGFSKRAIDDDARGARAIGAGDMDGDGDPDVVAALAVHGDIVWYESDGTDAPSFTRRTVGELDSAVALHVTDLNRDGALDVVAAGSQAGDVVYYTSDGAKPPGFTKRIIATALDGAVAVGAGDVDRDGDLDILAAGGKPDRIVWCESSGGAAPTFGRPQVIAFDSAETVEAVDLDLDGDMDVLAADSVGDQISWYENAGANPPVFIKRLLHRGFTGARGAAPADVDGDGDLDVVAAGRSAGVAWLANARIHGRAAFVKHIVDDAFDGAHSVAGADLDGDGDMDFVAVAGHHEIAWYRNDGSRPSNFVRLPLGTLSRSPSDAEAIDLDRDGDMDVVAAASGAPGELVWYENDGAAAPSFSKRIIDPAADGARSVRAADVNGDGALDLVAAVADAFVWYASSGDPSPRFVKHVFDVGAGAARDLLAADVDGDGDLDVLGAASGANEIAWYENDGSASPAFTIKRLIAADLADARVVYGADVDGDGDLDVIAAGGAALAWYENDGARAPRFQKRWIDSIATPEEVTSADVDQDGDLDLLVAASSSNTVAWYENDGARPPSFEPAFLDSDAFSLGAATPLDVDGDGDIDVVSAARGSNTVAILENRGGQFGLLTFATAPGRVEAGSSVAALRIDGMHLGRGGDSDVALDTLEFLFEETPGHPLSTEEVNARVARLKIYLDSGSERFEAEEDLLVANPPIQLDRDGTLKVSLPERHPSTTLGPDHARTFLVILELQGEAPSGPLRLTQVPHPSFAARDASTDERLKAAYWPRITAAVEIRGKSGAVSSLGKPGGALEQGSTAGGAPPRVGVQFPWNRATVAGTVDVTATAADDAGVAAVSFFVNGALRATDEAAPYSYSWNTTVESNGQHTLRVEASDAAGNTASSTIIVSVSNGTPVIAIEAPAAGATVSGVVRVQGSMFDDGGVVGGARLLVDGVLKETGTGGGIDFAWSTTNVQRGPHTLRVEATDSAGNTGIATVNVTVAPETLYNGIVLPADWPPMMGPTQSPISAPYLANPPPVILIDVGRQLFVDDFLIEQTNLVRSRHRPQLWSGNPVLRPGGHDNQGFSMVFSDGVWFDPADGLFKIWYLGDNKTGFSYATSTNGLDWVKPDIPDAAIPNTNVVLATNIRGDSSTVWLDQEETDPAKRFKAFFWRLQNSRHTMRTYFSRDGIHWGSEQLRVQVMSDRNTMFWNPFRKLWVKSMRRTITLPGAGARESLVARSRYYSESPNLISWNRADPPDPRTMFWQAADANDLVYPGTGGAYPQLYNMDSVAYESLIVGLFSMYYPDVQENGLTGPNLVELNVGFSRDGFHWDRVRGAGPAGAFIPASNQRGTWNGFNTQSAGGCFLVVGDELWFYFSGRELPKPDSGVSTTGLARMRRDGFASMDAGASEGVLTTRTVRFSGGRMFVNVNNPSGRLRVEVLDQNGAVIELFGRSNSIPISVDKTLHEVTWTGGGNLASLAGTPVKFRFLLSNGSLYSFWVSPDSNGASHGYVAAGGPGFTGPTDTIGAAGAGPPVENVALSPEGGTYDGKVEVAMASATTGAAIHYTLDGSVPTEEDPLYSQPVVIAATATLRAKAIVNGKPSRVTNATYVIRVPDRAPPAIVRSRHHALTSPSSRP